MTEQSKECAACLTVKPVGEFWKHNKYKDGRFPSCKKCEGAKRKEKATDPKPEPELDPAPEESAGACSPVVRTLHELGLKWITANSRRTPSSLWSFAPAISHAYPTDIPHEEAMP